jgi:sulfate transport system substrate-binding protein
VNIRRPTARLGALLAAGGVVAAGLVGCSSASTPSATGSSSGAPFSCPTTTRGIWSPTTPALTATPPSTSAGGTVNIVAYSVPKPAYDALTTAFKHTPAGAGVTFNASYGPSGTQSKNVAGGQKADYVAFSVGSDMTKLVPSKVAAGWDAAPTNGIVSDSVVVIAVRAGNPKHICGWDDLTKPGVKIVTPDPATSGSAKWNILAAYEHVLLDGGTEAQAQDYLAAFFNNVVVRASSGAVATTQFSSGTGDALISYEDEAIDARQSGQLLDYIVPAQSILIENPVAVTIGASPSATNFLNYVQSSAGQTIFAQTGFRPVVAGITPGEVKGANDPKNPFPNPLKIVTITELGGWSAVNTKFFAAGGIVTRIEGSS